jgi:hypothetical protein
MDHRPSPSLATVRFTLLLLLVVIFFDSWYGIKMHSTPPPIWSLMASWHPLLFFTLGGFLFTWLTLVCLMAGLPDDDEDDDDEDDGEPEYSQNPPEKQETAHLPS